MKKSNNSSKKESKFLQGIFTPHNPKKYKGTLPIVYRSSYELKLMRYLDNNPNVIAWGSETQIIPYRSPIDGRSHRYFVDNYAIYRINNQDYKFLIEVKPYKKLLKPKPTQGKKKSTLLQEEIEYAINEAKWKAAIEWAKRKGYMFRLITEKELPK